MHKYTQIKKIGQGSFGTAILCRTVATGELVVIKTVDVREMPEEERKGVRKEAALLAHLSHPAIIRHIESFEADGHLCIVTEYAERGDLSARLEERKGVWLPESQVLSYFVQMCLALLYLHKRKVLHRDLKLANVFITGDNEVRLGDFGIARVLRATMECARTVVGTPYYLSPEICESKPYNHKSDVWSAGCILYELCCQRHAFEGSSLTALVRKILKGRFDPLPPIYSDDLRNLVTSILQLKPGLRPAISQILALPFLQPYVRDYATRVGRRGWTLPFLETVSATPLLAAPSGVVGPEGAAAVAAAYGGVHAGDSVPSRPASGGAGTDAAMYAAAYAAPHAAAVAPAGGAERMTAPVPAGVVPSGVRPRGVSPSSGIRAVGAGPVVPMAPGAAVGGGVPRPSSVGRAGRDALVGVGGAGAPSYRPTEPVAYADMARRRSTPEAAAASAPVMGGRPSLHPHAPAATPRALVAAAPPASGGAPPAYAPAHYEAYYPRPLAAPAIAAPAGPAEPGSGATPGAATRYVLPCYPTAVVPTATPSSAVAGGRGRSPGSDGRLLRPGVHDPAGGAALPSSRQTPTGAVAQAYRYASPQPPVAMADARRASPAAGVMTRPGSAGTAAAPMPPVQASPAPASAAIAYVADGGPGGRYTPRPASRGTSPQSTVRLTPVRPTGDGHSLHATPAAAPPTHAINPLRDAAPVAGRQPLATASRLAANAKPAYVADAGQPPRASAPGSARSSDPGAAATPSTLVSHAASGRATPPVMSSGSVPQPRFESPSSVVYEPGSRVPAKPTAPHAAARPAASPSPPVETHVDDAAIVAGDAAASAAAAAAAPAGGVADRSKYHLSLLRNPDFKPPVVPVTDDAAASDKGIILLPRRTTADALRGGADAACGGAAATGCAGAGGAADLCESEEGILKIADRLLPHGLPLVTYKDPHVLAKTIGKTLGASKKAGRGKAAASASLPVALEEPCNRGSDSKHSPPAAPASALAFQRGRDHVEGKFIHDNGSTLHLPAASSSDPLSYRVEALRLYLSEELGEDAFLKMYQGVCSDAVFRGCKPAAAGDCNPLFKEQVARITAAMGDNAHLVPLFYQLLHCEQRAFSN